MPASSGIAFSNLSMPPAVLSSVPASIQNSSGGGFSFLAGPPLPVSQALSHMPQPVIPKGSRGVP